MKSKTIKIFLILNLILTMIFVSLPKSQIVFAQENTNSFEIVDCQVNIADIDKYNYINIYSENINLLSTELNKVCFINNDNIKTFYNYGTNDGQITAPKFVKQIDDKFAVFDINRIQIFETDLNYLKRFTYIDNTPLPLALGNIVSMSTDYAGNIYMLDMTNNLILKLNITDDIISKIQLEQQIEVTDNSRLCVNANGDKIAVINASENNFIINIKNQSTQNINNTVYNDVFFDCMDNLYLLNKDVSTTNITKYECNNYASIETKQINATYNSVDIDIETGTVYFLGNKVYKITNDTFFASASTEVTPVDITSTSAHNTALPVCATKNNAKLYSTCVSFASSIVLNDNTKVVILQSEIPQNKNMNFCMAVQNGTEIFGYIEISNLTNLSNTLNQTEYKTICKNVNILSYPSKNAGVVQTIANENHLLTITGNVCEYTDSNNQLYFEVKIDNKVAYIEQRYLVKTNLNEIEKIDTPPVDTNQNQFIAMVLTIVCLLVVTIFICYILHKKSKHQIANRDH